MRWATYLLCLAGIFTTGMLSVSYLYRLQLPCGGSSGCTAVALSAAARIAGIPTPLLGLGFFLVLAVFTFRTLLASNLSTTPMTDVGSSLDSPLGPNPSPSARGIGELANRGSGKSGATGIVLNSFSYWFALTGAAASTGFTIYGVAVLHAACAWCLASNILACLLAAMLGFDQKEQPATTAKAKIGVIVGSIVAFVAMGIGAKLFINHARRFPWNPAALAKSTLNDLAPVDSVLLNASQTGPTIVMFVDLQCPACQASFQAVYNAALKDHARLAIRQMPHRKIHPESYALAVQAEEAAQQGQGLTFLADAFKQSVDDRLKGRALLRELKLRESPALVQEAEARIKRDKALAKQLGLTETPSIFLVRPNHAPEAVAATSVEEALRAW